jgi:hypothetical protein
VVQSDFSSQLASGEVVWKVVNYEEPAGGDLAARFDIQMPLVVLARMKDGQIENWNCLDRVWPLVGDEVAFAEYVRSEIAGMLDDAEKKPTPTPGGDLPAIPVPGVDPEETPAPTGPADLPIPQ